ncbi:hypothetical protein AHiyo8_47040 [Arthrobacter sp. Hiyo8]|nr:hypothetical protein AHiyo8_47040 [Arthrobacter sp. Hiyo8]
MLEKPRKTRVQADLVGKFQRHEKVGRQLQRGLEPRLQRREFEIRSEPRVLSLCEPVIGGVSAVADEAGQSLGADHGGRSEVEYGLEGGHQHVVPEHRLKTRAAWVLAVCVLAVCVLGLRLALGGRVVL